MGLRYIIKLFKTGNVCVTGLRGKGKDLLFGNVITRRKAPYASNLNYTLDDNYNELDFEKINLGKNTYENFISGNLNYYEYPYPYGSDIYVSDVGVYLPSQYCNEINKKHPFIAFYQALSRQVSANNFHINVQNLNRAYDKIREQSDTYIRCTHCFYIPLVNLVIQRVVIYDKYEACCDRVNPCPIKVPLLSRGEARLRAKTYIDDFRVRYGSVKSKILIYRNKSKHDTLYFGKLLKGANNEKNN